MSLDVTPIRSFLAVRWALLVGALLRVAAFPFAEDLFGDGPVRASVAQSWARTPGVWWSFGHVYQFGPLPVHLEGALIALGLPVDIGARAVPLALGVLGVALAGRLGRRLGGDGAAALAAWAVALDPLHLQASTTCTSETTYLAFALAAAIGFVERRPALLALAAFGAATTRYDAWIWLPVVAVAVVARARGSARSLVEAMSLALGPASILLANQLESGEPLLPLAYISESHAQVSALVATRLPPLLWRLGSTLFWPAAIFVALTPVLGWLASRALRATRPAPAASTSIVASIGLLPSAIYVLRGLVLGSFLPVPRMAIAPATFLACLAPEPPLRWLRRGVAVAIAFDLGLLALASVSTKADEVACRITPVSRLPADLRAAVAAIRSSRGSLALDHGELWEDIVIAYHAHVDRFPLYAPAGPVDRAIALRGGSLERELRATGHFMGRACVEAGRSGRVSWWDCDAREEDAGSRQAR